MNLPEDTIDGERSIELHAPIYPDKVNTLLQDAVRAAVTTGQATRITASGALRARITPASDDEPQPEPEPESAHLHQWEILGAQPRKAYAVFGPPPAFTVALVRCGECGVPDALTLTGEWTLEDLQAEEAAVTVREPS